MLSFLPFYILFFCIANFYVAKSSITRRSWRSPNCFILSPPNLISHSLTHTLPVLTENPSNGSLTILGIEVHAQLQTKSKAFCPCLNYSTVDVSEPNTFICDICLGRSSNLLQPKDEMVHLGFKAAMALKCNINPEVIFDRKHYVFADCPRNYQITQYRSPVGVNGEVKIGLKDGSIKGVKISHVMMEEDTAKSQDIIDKNKNSFINRKINNHNISSDKVVTGEKSLDFNRAGVPLVEVVTEPWIGAPSDAVKVAEAIRLNLLHAGVSRADMAAASFRIDVNVNLLLPDGSRTPKVELKNMNSYKAIMKAIQYETHRQQTTKVSGLKSETRGWNNPDKKTTLNRPKTGLYNYEPEPRLTSRIISASLLDRWRAAIPELPFEKHIRYELEFSLKRRDAKLLSRRIDIANYFERAVEARAPPLDASRWIINELSGLAARQSFDDLLLQPTDLARILCAVTSSTISNTMAKTLIRKIMSGEYKGSVSDVLKEDGFVVMNSGNELNDITEAILHSNKALAQKYREGKKNVIHPLVEKVLSASGGRADPVVVHDMVRRKIENMGF